MEKSTSVKIGAAVLASAVAGAGLTAGLQTQDITQEQVNALVLEAQAKAFAEGKASVIIPTVDTKAIEAAAFAAGVASVEPEKVLVNNTIFVGSEELAEIQEAIMDNNGNVSFCTQDLEDNEAHLIGDCLVLTNDFKAIALAEAKKEIADLVDREVVANVTIDEDDVERIRLNNDLDEVTVSDLDFEDKDADVFVTGTFEHDDVKYEFEVKVEFKDGEVEEVSLEDVSLA